MNLKTRLDGHFVACSAVAAAAAMGGMAQNSEAAIVYSGVVNLTIPASTNGLYINVVNGMINEPGNTGGATVPGWDLNLWGSSSLSFFNPSTPSGGVYYTGGGTTVSVLAGGETIDGSGTWGSSNTQWNPTATGIVGFRFQNELTSQVHYGWGRIVNNGSSDRQLVEYAYEDAAGVGIVAGAIPTPGSAALLAVGAAGLVGRRRR